MAQEFLICDKQELIAIADAVREKTGNTDTYTVSELPDAIEAIEAGGGEVSVITTTISEEQAEWTNTLTIPELIGAKYFIIQGNPWTATMMMNATYMDDNYVIHQLIYLNGTIYCSYPFGANTAKNAVYTFSGINCSEDFSFDQTTGTITTDGINSFAKLTSDTSTTGIAYTVYRLG